MPTSRDRIEREVFIPARPETVFRFLLEPELMARWIGRCLFSNAVEGGVFRLQFSFGDGHIAAGVFTEISPPDRVAFRFGWEGSEGFPPGTSLVDIQVRAHDDGTLLHLTHSGFPEVTEPKFTQDEHGDRWSHYLRQLAQAV
jgi:uncharacterized protein YndB with AHSA1/START domain